MNFLNRIYVRISEARRSPAGQTMTEYVLILSAVGIAGYAAYQGLGGGIVNFSNSVVTSLKAA